MSNDYSVSGNVDGWCTKCKLLLAHTIIAMANNMPVKVKCNTCNSSHKFRTKQFGIRKRCFLRMVPEYLFTIQFWAQIKTIWQHKIVINSYIFSCRHK